MFTNERQIFQSECGGLPASRALARRTSSTLADPGRLVGGSRGSGLGARGFSARPRLCDGSTASSSGWCEPACARAEADDGAGDAFGTGVSPILMCQVHHRTS